jgi:hypothetical protein
LEAAEAGFLYHNGNIDKNLGAAERIAAFNALMNTLDYTRIKIDSNLPVSSSFEPDFSAVGNELRENDYFKWDIEYNDHRILIRFYYFGPTNYTYSYTLVNEVLLYPPINGNDYSKGTINHVDYVYGASDTSVIDNALYNDKNFDEFIVAGNAPVDNLGLLQFRRIVNEVQKARSIKYRAGDYLKWKINYKDSEWVLRFFIMVVNPDGSWDIAKYEAVKTAKGGTGSVRYIMKAGDAGTNYSSARE